MADPDPVEAVRDLPPESMCLFSSCTLHPVPSSDALSCSSNGRKLLEGYVFDWNFQHYSDLISECCVGPRRLL